MAKSLLTLCFLLIFTTANSQNIFFSEERKFLSHLDSIGEKKEKSAYLEYLLQQNKYAGNDSFNLELGFTYYENLNFEKANLTFNLVKGFRTNKKFRSAYGNTLLNNHRYSKFENNFDTWPPTADSIYLIQKLSALALSDAGTEKERDELRQIIPFSVSEKQLRKKSPAKAGIYSAVIPGMGKLYCGKKSQFFTAFIASAALGAQTWEAGVKDGTNSARFIVSGILFSFFYIGNIWGSVLAARNYHNEQYKQFEYEILDYNNSIVAASAQ